MRPTHISNGAWEPDEDGWHHATCQCGFSFGPVPDVETLIDVLMEHAYEAGAGERFAVFRPEDCSKFEQGRGWSSYPVMPVGTYFLVPADSGGSG